MMVSAIISRIVILLFGTLYPAYASYKAVKTKNVKEYVKWMMYWIVFALFITVETFADVFISWIPFYFELKILFVLWLLSPATKGSSILYRKFVHPQLAKRETEIDTYIAKASDQGYTALLNIGSKGINYATNVVLQTAIKGQSKIADHLRKSYSMNDLSQPQATRAQLEFDQKPTIEESEEEMDNRMIEEYRQERRQLYEREGRTISEDSVDGGREFRQPRRSYTDAYASESFERTTDDINIESSPKTRKSYTHKEVSHYGTLPRTKTRTTRASVKKTIY